MRNTTETMREVLNSFKTKADKLYWLKVMVTLGDITTVQAGRITVTEGI